jgi:hypothetical protein
VHLSRRTTKSAGMWTVRDGEKGPVEIEMIRRRVQTRIERKRTGPKEWLVVPATALGRPSLGAPRLSGCHRSGRPLPIPILPQSHRCVRCGVSSALASRVSAGDQSGCLYRSELQTRKGRSGDGRVPGAHLAKLASSHDTITVGRCSAPPASTTSTARCNAN